MVSRAERSALASWWWTIDRWIFAAVGALMVLGLVLTMAGSPPVAERLGLSSFHFVHRQVLYLIPSVVILIAASFLSPRQVRRVALVVFLVSIALIFVALLYGHEIKGSRRWIFGIQPSEFLKPAFVILVAWAFSEAGKRRDVPANLLALLLLLVTVVPFDSAAGFRPDDAGLAGLDGAVLHGRAALALGCGPRRRGCGSRVACL